MESLRDKSAPVEGEDFYREGAYVVFTERYHLRRGYCCESGCRHCPYRGKPEGAPGVGKKKKKTGLKDESSL